MMAHLPLYISFVLPTPSLSSCERRGVLTAAEQCYALDQDAAAIIGARFSSFYHGGGAMEVPGSKDAAVAAVELWTGHLGARVSECDSLYFFIFFNLG
ncbi:gfo/Idh/MocA family oxidoreductase [Sesbania bispinosa]|nr:gfo/Idh/MocA family oxidoreductase [Sesbania bispinosa]